jgi:hypothetical protein
MTSCRCSWVRIEISRCVALGQEAPVRVAPISPLGTILIDSARRSPNRACRQSDMWMKDQNCISLSMSSFPCFDMLVT